MYNHTFSKPKISDVYSDHDHLATAMTHNLRSPIASVMQAILLAKDTQDAEEVHDLLLMMQRAMVNLDKFIDQTCDYYYLRNVRVHPENIDFQNISDEIRDVYKICQQINGVRLRIDIEQYGTFRSDRLLLHIILNNLVSNAIKYQRSDEQDQWVLLNIYATDSQAVIEITDNGIGIDDQYIHRIFEPFFRATSGIGGSGFGLYIVQDALFKLKGSVSVDSALNAGTSFRW